MKKPRNAPSASKAGNKPGPAAARRFPPLTVLHIDDDPNDTELFQAAARKANAQFAIHNVSDGEQAMAYLNGRGLYADRQLYPLPALILLDLKMPRATGFEVLQWIRNHPEAGHLRVIILSGSELKDDIERAYAHGADSYLVKPLGFSELVNLVKNLNAHWLTPGLRDASALASSAAFWPEVDGAWPGDGSKARP